MKKKKVCQVISDEMIEYLEIKIDNMEKTLPKLTKFILPCVTLVDSESHLCRTQTRKCERMLCNLNESYILDKNIIIYINRLSDFFFVLSRYICYNMGKIDFFRK
jgi:cob(I)alamin adenosyltransferase